MRDLVGICHNRPRLFRSGFAISKLRFGFASLAWSCTQYAISDGGGCSDGWLRRRVCGGGGIPMACGSVGSLEYFL